MARLTTHEVVEALRTQGFRLSHAERYAMYYRHEAGWVCAALSQPLLLPMVHAGWRVANQLVGRWGNKVTVQAVREG